MVIDEELGEALAKNEEASACEIAAVLRRQVERDYPPSNRPARRDAHPKAHGCVKAVFKVEENLSSEFAHGVFVPGKSYAAWVRFSNGNSDPHRSDAKGDAHGMAIKLLGVPGEKILSEEKKATTQDFLLIDHPVFVVDDPARYLALFQGGASKHLLARLLAPFALGLRGMLTALATTTKKIGSPLEARYWSTTAYQLGTGKDRIAVKYSAQPYAPPLTQHAIEPGPDFLRAVLTQQLHERAFQFDFLVQPRMPACSSVEESTVEWLESEAPFHKVATITIPQQTFTSSAQEAFAEHLSFTPWHALPEHRPLGVVNRVRRIVYEEISRIRHQMNGVPRTEPTEEESFEG